MKQVTLFEIKERRYVVEDSLRYLRRQESPRVLQGFPDGSVGMATSNYQEVPINHIISGGRDLYLAIAPELRSLLETPIRSSLEGEILNLQDMVREKDFAIAHQKRSLNEAEERIAAIRSMPAWKRAWKAMRGEI